MLPFDAPDAVHDAAYSVWRVGVIALFLLASRPIYTWVLTTWPQLTPWDILVWGVCAIHLVSAAAQHCAGICAAATWR